MIWRLRGLRVRCEAVLAPFDPYTERAKRRNGRRNAVGILVLELLRVADDGPTLRRAASAASMGSSSIMLWIRDAPPSSMPRS